MKKRFLCILLAAATCLPLASTAFAQKEGSRIESHYNTDEDFFFLSEGSLKTMKTSSGTRVWNVTVKDFVKALDAIDEDYNFDNLKKVKDKNIFYQKYRETTIYFYGTSDSYSKGYLKKVVVKCKLSDSDRNLKYAASIVSRVLLIFSGYDPEMAMDILYGLEMDDMDGSTSISTSKNTAKFKLEYPDKTHFTITASPKA